VLDRFRCGAYPRNFAVTATHVSPTPPRSNGAHGTAWLPGLALAGVCLLALAWNDVLAGGWRLHGWFEPHALAARRAQARRSAGRLLVFRAEAPSIPHGVVAFLGSSTIERFPLRACFPGRPCLDLGIGNETAPELLRRLEASLPEAPLAGAVLFTGRVDFLAGTVPAAEIGRRVEAVVSKLQELQPKVPIALVGILPGRGMPAEEVLRLDLANAELSDLALERSLFFVDTARMPVRDATGSLPEDLSADRLHLNTAGYRVLADWILEDGGEVARRLAP